MASERFWDGNEWTQEIRFTRTQDDASVQPHSPPPMQYVIPAAYSPPAPAPLPTGLATTSLVLGIIGLATSLLCSFGILLAIPAFVTGIVAVRKCDQGKAAGKGMAITGIVTGGVSLVLLGAIFAVYGFAYLSES